MFDTSLRVSCLVQWPGNVPAGLRLEETLTNLDWYPTLLAMAGLSTTGPGSGRNALPLLLGEQVPWDDAFYGEYAIHHYTEADLRMFRTRGYKLVQDLLHPSRDELYDLASDAGETTNVIRDPRYASVLAEASMRLENAMKSLRRPGR